MILLSFVIFHYYYLLIQSTYVFERVIRTYVSYVVIIQNKRLFVNTKNDNIEKLSNISFAFFIKLCYNNKNEMIGGML